MQTGYSTALPSPHTTDTETNGSAHPRKRQRSAQKRPAHTARVCAGRFVYAGRHYTRWRPVSPKLTAMAASTLSITALVHTSHLLPQPLFVQRAYLLQQDDRIPGQSASSAPPARCVWAGCALPSLGGDGRRDNGGAVAVAGVVLHDQHRAHAALLAAHHGAEIGIVNVAASDSSYPHSSHSDGRSTGGTCIPRSLSIVPRGRGIYTPPRR